MNITTIGRGNIGGGLAQFWRAAGHEVDELGRDGGDASGADVVVVAVPGGQIADALAKVQGLEGKTVVDTTNALGGRPEGFDSLAHQVKSSTNGPVMKAFNTIFARAFDRIASAQPTPSCLFCGDDEARPVTEQLIRDTGLEPVYVGGLEHAAFLEDVVPNLLFPVMQAGGGPFLYRFGL